MDQPRTQIVDFFNIRRISKDPLFRKEADGGKMSSFTRTGNRLLLYNPTIGKIVSVKPPITLIKECLPGFKLLDMLEI